jgi:ClpP class serine protease
MSENRYGEKREESETGMKLQNCETQESENKVQESTNEQIKDMGQVVLNSNSRKHKVELLTIIGEVEGHESAPSHSKTTKYEHVLPKLAIIEDDEEIEGLLILLNTVGGDVEAGLAIAEMIASLSIPTVSLVLGGGHSIGVPMAVSGLFFRSTKCYDGDPSGTFQWYVYRSGSDLPEYGENSGPYHYIYFRTLQSISETSGRADA